MGMMTCHPTFTMRGLDFSDGEKEIGPIEDYWQKGDPFARE